MNEKPEISSPKIFVAGHNGMAGSAIVRSLQQIGLSNIITKSRDELDLTDQSSVKNFFMQEKPDQVYLAAAKVGGILANNTFPANFIYENLMIQANVINSSFLSGVKKLLFLGSSCIYPRLADQPMREEALLTGKLEPTNEPYALAKIAGIKLCESYNRQFHHSHKVDYRSVMPTNLYGPGDNFDNNNSHVIPALIKRFHQAKTNNQAFVKIWGSGKPLREFLFVDDMARASIHVMNLDKEEYDLFTSKMNSQINIGSGQEVSINQLALIIKDIVGFKGKLEYDSNMPDGTPRKLLDSSKLNKTGWSPEIDLIEGISRTYEYFKGSDWA